MNKKKTTNSKTDLFFYIKKERLWIGYSLIFTLFFYILTSSISLWREYNFYIWDHLSKTYNDILLNLNTFFISSISLFGIVITIKKVIERDPGIYSFDQLLKSTSELINQIPETQAERFYYCYFTLDPGNVSTNWSEHYQTLRIDLYRFHNEENKNIITTVVTLNPFSLYKFYFRYKSQDDWKEAFFWSFLTLTDLYNKYKYSDRHQLFMCNMEDITISTFFTEKKGILFNTINLPQSDDNTLKTEIKPTSQNVEIVGLRIEDTFILNKLINDVDTISKKNSNARELYTEHPFHVILTECYHYLINEKDFIKRIKSKAGFDNLNLPNKIIIEFEDIFNSLYNDIEIYTKEPNNVQYEKTVLKTFKDKFNHYKNATIDINTH